MDQLHQDYLSYYQVRYQRFEGKSMYKNTYEAEKAMYELLASCTTLEEFGPKLKETKLNEKAALAWIKDTSAALATVYEQIKEPIRAEGPRKIAEGVMAQPDLATAMTWQGDIDKEGMIKISVDGFLTEFANNLTFKVLEDIEVSTHARDNGPSEFKSDLQRSIDDAMKLGREGYEMTLKNNREWQPGWELDYELVWEDRHRRVLACPDAELKLKIQQHKPYIGK